MSAKPEISNVSDLERDIENLRIKDVNAKNLKETVTILSLNDYCILNILEYLTHHDWESLKLVDPMFKRVIISQETYTIDSTKMDHSVSYFERIGDRSKRLIVGDITTEELGSVFGFFTHLDVIKFLNSGRVIQKGRVLKKKKKGKDAKLN